MSLFEDVGRRVERFKQQVTSAADDEADRECEDCGTLVYTDRSTCPECGGERLELRSDDTETDAQSS